MRPDPDYTYEFLMPRDEEEMYAADDSAAVAWVDDWIPDGCGCGSDLPMERCCGYE
jgi:hypothetical protein